MRGPRALRRLSNPDACPHRQVPAGRFELPELYRDCNPSIDRDLYVLFLDTTGFESPAHRSIARSAAQTAGYHGIDQAFDRKLLSATAKAPAEANVPAAMEHDAMLDLLVDDMVIDSSWLDGWTGEYSSMHP